MPLWIKDPDEGIDFGIDWTPVIGDDTINTSEWIGPVPAGITVGTGPKAPSINGKVTTIWLSGGTVGVEYRFTNRIVTLGGRTFDRDQAIRIQSTPTLLPGYDGCLWPLDPACLTEEWDKYDDTVRTRATALASSSLYRLTGYRVGGCPVKVRPRPQRGLCAIPLSYATALPYQPILLNGLWRNATCPPCSDPRLVDLPSPVGEVSEVKVDGVVLPPSDYRIVDRHYLAWAGTGDPPWPGEQDYVVPDTEPGTFSVTYLNSYPVDSLGAYAAGLLAVEFAKACSSGGSKCKLPSNVISIVRQGVTYELSAGAFPDGKTSIREVDVFIEQWNPKGRRPGQVLIPGKRIAVSER